jgi:hypothetical protein
MNQAIGSGATQLFGDEVTILVPAVSEVFIARERFVESIKADSKIRIAHIGGEFKKDFLDGGGKIEEPIGQTVLSYRNLLMSAIDARIIEALGGESHVSVSLGQVFALLLDQPTGSKDKTGLNDTLKVRNESSEGASSIFFVQDMKGILRTVSVSWLIDGWWVLSHDVVKTDRRFYRWEFGNRVFFPRPHPLSIYA